MLLKNALLDPICGSTLVSLPMFGQEDAVQQGSSVNCGFRAGSVRRLPIWTV